MRASLAVIANAAVLSGCVSEPKAWVRPDGQAINPSQLELDRTACKGEVERAAIAGQSESTVDNPVGMDRQDNRAFLGCMASYGYLAAKGN